ncbi:MAG TPA: outer membrane protein transport protein [Lentisphaeria bacterium]|nr:outer membrane protein transport protein [Lentisphaeria bacterium]
MFRKQRLRSLVVFAVMLAAMGTPAWSAGFSILEQSIPGAGRALAGMTADIEDPSALYFNAAAPAWFEKGKIIIGNHFLRAKAEFEDKGSTATGEDNGSFGGWSVIPNIYWVQPVSSTVSVGLGMSATSGTSTGYNTHWRGKYIALDTEIAVVSINPTISWKALDTLSIGAGPVIEYADVCLSQVVPYSLKPLPGGPYPDGQLKLKGDSVAMGFAIGALYIPVEGTRLGIGYRSRITHDLDLEARVRGSVPTGARVTDDAQADLDLPAMLNLGVQQDITERWTVMADVCWSEWSVMEELKVNFDPEVAKALGWPRGPKNDETIKMNWRDCWRVGLGTEYDLNDKWTVRCGVAYDQTPVEDVEDRTPRLPDADRYWLTCGAQYRYSENITLDLGYVHIFFKDVKMDYRDVLGQTVKGDITGSADIFSMGMTYTF